MALLREEGLHEAVSVLVRLVEAAGAIVIFSGACLGFLHVVGTTLRRRDAKSFEQIRLELARLLALGLEFQLASDLLRTAVAPTFIAIGQLAAVAAIRTVLNFFLGREIREESTEVHAPPARPREQKAAEAP